MNNRHCPESTYQIKISHSLPYKTLTHTCISCLFTSSSSLQSFPNRISICINRPQRIRHIYQIFIRPIHCKGQIGRRSPIIIACKNFTYFKKSALKVKPRRIIQRIYSLETLFIILIKIIYII